MTRPERPLFAYGTLRHPPLLAGVLGRAVAAGALRRSVATDCRAVPYPGGRTYPALLAAPARSAEGLLIEGLAPFDLEILDVFEGSEYRRGPVIVIGEDGKRVEADAYWPVGGVDQSAPDWDFAAWVANHSAAALVEYGALAAAIRGRLRARVLGEAN